MRKQLIILASIAATICSPALAQGRGNGGHGAGPPISPPGQSGGAGSAERAGSIASQRGQFGRDFADQQRLTATQRAEQRRLDVAEYRGQSERRKADALAYAQAARGNRALPASAARDIRSALKRDMEDWRETFSVGRSDWQAMRDQWLVDKDSLTPEQWAVQRANWFSARDAWIASQKEWAQLYGK